MIYAPIVIILAIICRAIVVSNFDTSIVIVSSLVNSPAIISVIYVSIEIISCTVYGFMIIRMVLAMIIMGVMLIPIDLRNFVSS